MSLARLWVVRLGFITLALSLISFATIGGCPQPQQPGTLPDTGDDTGGDAITDDTPANSERPIPPPPIEPVEPTDGEPPTTPGGTSSQPIVILITAPQDADLNVAPGTQASVAYEVFGGNPANGAINVTLFYDKDGLDGTGDEHVFKAGLPPQGSEDLATASLASGTYYLGVRAANSKQNAIAYAAGRLVVVGEPKLALIQPTANQVVRPGAAVAVQFSIDSLAASVSYDVFVDPDTTVNGNEVAAFNGGGLSGTGIIFTDGYAAGLYYIGATVSDSTGHEKTFYLSGAGGLRTITIDLAPKVSVPFPNTSTIVQPGDKVDVSVHAEDPEGAATVAVFRDIDGTFNNNEVPFATFALTTPQADFALQFDTTGLPAGTYRIGASVTDGVGNPVAGYATGTVRINAIPQVTIQAPTSNVTVQAGTPANVQWTAMDLENKLRAVKVLLAPDQNANGLPDGNWATVETFTGTPSQLASLRTYDIDTTTLMGRYVVAISAEDDIVPPAVGIAIAPGAIIVTNDAPVITISAPTARLFMRPGGLIAMSFFVSDRERSILPQPAGIQVVIAPDANCDGQADGPPVYAESDAFFFLGQNAYEFDTEAIETAGLLDAAGNGCYMLGVRVEDEGGNVTIVYAAGGLLIDSVVPTIELVDPADHHIQIKPGSVHVKVRTNDTSETTFSVRLDTNATPDQGGPNEPLLIPPTPAPAGINEFEFDVDAATLPEALFAYRLFIADAVAPTEATYAPVDADQGDFAELRKLCVTDGSFVTFTQPATQVGARPGMFLPVQFTVNVCDPALKPQLDGLKLILARDDDGDGLPDGDPVFVETSAAFGPGANSLNLDTQEIVDAGLLDAGGNARFVIGVETQDMIGSIYRAYGSPVLIDGVEPTVVLVEPAFNAKPIVVDRSITTLTIRVQITDTSTDALTILLDRDNDPATTSPDDILVADKVAVPPGTPSELTFTVNFSDPPEIPKALGLYFIHVSVADGLDPAVEWYGPDDLANQTDPNKLTRVNVRDRLVGDFYLDTLNTPPEADPPVGAILQGYQFNDLAGTSMTRVPDLNGDGVDELLAAARYGKPYLIQTDGVGFGEAYLVYGGERMRGSQSVNAVGRGDIDGLLFPGIRIPLNTTWTQGLTDVGYIPDMDGDEKPELVFCFPRVEALSLQVEDPAFQHPELFPDIPNAGNYEYNAYDPMAGWIPNTSQFVRGGIVIVSSQNATITNSTVLNRKGDRILDLAEVGQLFGNMQAAQIVPYIKAVVDDMPPRGTIDCTPPPGLSQDPTMGACCKVEGGCEEMLAADCAALPRPGTFLGVGIGCTPDPCAPDIRETVRKVVLWDTVLDNQGPGGFHMPWTAVPADPPLTNPGVVPFPTMTPPWVLFYFDHPAECDNLCEWYSTWYVWPPCPFGPMPCTQFCPPAWDAGFVSVWTGFYGPFTNITDLTVGARVLGQDAEDRFGTSVASDGEFLYIAAPRHTALKADAPGIPLVADTPARDDDIQVVAVGHSVHVYDIIVRVGPDGILQSVERGDDKPVDIIVAGPDNNGLADSTAAAADVQVVAVGGAVVDGDLIVAPGTDSALTSTPSGDDVIVDAIVAIAHNTRCDTTKLTGSDDIQRVQPNANAIAGTVLIAPGTDGALNSAPAGDDITSQAIFEPAQNGNGRCNTPKQGDDVQVVANGAVALAGVLLISPGPNGILETTASTDDVALDVIIQPGDFCLTTAQDDDVQRVLLRAPAPAGTVLILPGPDKTLDTPTPTPGPGPSGYGQQVSVIIEPIPAVDTAPTGDDLVAFDAQGDPMDPGHLTSPGDVIIVPGPNNILDTAPLGDDRVEKAIIQPLPDRVRAGVVYQMRVNTRSTPAERNKAQLWLEPGMAYPTPDAQFPGRTDWTMPLPHHYIIETIGSYRGNWTNQIKDLAGGDANGCPPAFDPGIDQAQADACTGYAPYDINTAGDLVDRVNQIVGPQEDSQISYVKSVGDVNDDGVPDFAVGAETIKSDLLDPYSPVVGAVFVVFARPTGAQGDYLLEKIALSANDPGRLRGVLLKGQTGEKLARVFDGAGDVNGDGVADVIVGNEAGNAGTGEAIVMLGSRTLASPAGGYTVDSIVADHRAIWFRGAAVGDLAGANVAGAGDVDGDGYADILIAAPGAADPNDPTSHPGVVYLVYGSSQLPETINLADVATPIVPGVKIVGRVDGDALGGGTMLIPDTDPNGGSSTVVSRGVTKLGDLDGDGLDDYGISAILASPFQQYHAGEMYIMYGKGE